MGLGDAEARTPLVQCYLPREFPGFEVVDLQASIRFVVGEDHEIPIDETSETCSMR